MGNAPKVKFKLSELLIKNTEHLKKLKTKSDLNRFVKRLILDNGLTKDLSSVILLKQLEKSKDFEASQQVVWNSLLASSGAYVGKTITKNSWYKGTAISGMECHSH